MSEEIKDGGKFDQPFDLRDWFAGMALSGLAANQESLLANHDLLQKLGTLGIDRLQANKAYRLADALLREREKEAKNDSMD